MHGTRTANYAMDEADLIVAIGARFDDRITGKLSEFAPRAKFIHIDVDPAEISKNVPAHIPIVGDAKNILPKLTAEYRALDADPARLEGWWQRIHGWQEKHPLRYEDSRGLRDQAAVHGRGDVRGHRRPGDHHLRRRPAPDVGRAVLRLHAPAPVDQLRRPGHDGLRPARRAMGAKVACPDEDVVCLAGDGSLIMNVQELATCVDRADPGEGVPDEQRLPRHGPPVAGAVLGQALLVGRDGREPRLGQAGRGLRRQGHAAWPTRPS